MIMNPPSHRILLASINPCYPCFGIIIHFDEWLADLTQTLADASQVPSAHNPGVWTGAAATCAAPIFKK
jgi:hypothetical protein